jgi:hypothetical protein
LIHRRFIVSNSLTELNGFSTQSVTYSDDRPYTISFSSVVNPSISIDEDEIFAIPTGTDILQCFSIPRSLTYVIDVSTVISQVPVLSWTSTLPAHIQVSQLLPGVYTVTGIRSTADWNQVRSPTMLVPDRDTNFVFSASLTYPDPANTANNAVVSWSVNVVILETNNDVVFDRTYSFDEDQLTQIQYVIDDADPTAINYTVQVLPTENAQGRLILNGSAAPAGQSVTIKGSKVDVAAANITYVPYPDSTSNVTLTANAWKENSSGNVQMNSNVSLTLNIANTHSEFSLVTPGVFYNNVFTPIDLTIIDQDVYATQYQSELYSTANFVVNGNTTANIATISDSKANISSANIGIVSDNNSSVTVFYNQSKTNSLFGNITQVVDNATVLQPYFSGLKSSRTYTTFQAGLIFGGSNPAPTINASLANLTITVSSSDGWLTFPPSGSGQIPSTPDQNPAVLGTSAVGVFNPAQTTFANFVSRINFVPHVSNETVKTVSFSVNQGNTVVCNTQVSLNRQTVSLTPGFVVRSTDSFDAPGAPVVYGNNQFVQLGIGRVLTSVYGTGTWRSISLPSSPHQYRALFYANNQYFVFARTAGGPGQGSSWARSDIAARSWTSNASLGLPGMETPSDLKYFNDRWIISYQAPGAWQGVYTSSDFVTWTQVTSDPVGKIHIVNNRVVAGSLYSTDAETWSSTGTTEFVDLYWTGSEYVGLNRVSSVGKTIVSSSNLTNWTTRYTAPSTVSLFSLTLGNGTWLATGSADGSPRPARVYRSTNLTSWTQITTLPQQYGLLVDSSWTNGYFYVVSRASGSTPGYIIRSGDGIAWEALDSNSYSFLVNNGFVTVASGANNLISGS